MLLQYSQLLHTSAYVAKSNSRATVVVVCNLLILNVKYTKYFGFYWLSMCLHAQRRCNSIANYKVSLRKFSNIVVGNGGDWVRRLEECRVTYLSHECLCRLTHALMAWWCNTLNLYTLNLKCITSPSCTMYSLPSKRILPASFEPCSPLFFTYSS